MVLQAGVGVVNPLLILLIAVVLGTIAGVTAGWIVWCLTGG